MWKNLSCEKLIFFELCSFFAGVIIIDLKHWDETGVEVEITRPLKN
jgi:hypothetical protein